MTKNYLEQLSNRIFNDLKNGEELSLGLHSEHSDFVRFNQSKVRQNTTVAQHELALQFNRNHRSYLCTANVTLDLEQDTKNILQQILELRKVLDLIDENPKFEAMKNNGQSEVYKKSQRPETTKIIDRIAQEFSDSDLAGFYCAGPLRKASVNSKGQFHYFENDHFFFDYSIYDGPRASKGYYSDENWNDSNFSKQASEIKNTLSLLKKPQKQLKPGSYRTYLAPMATKEIVEMFNWRAVSRAAYEQGFAPLKKLHTREQLLSPQFSLIENNTLGLNTHFNNSGELSPANLPIIEKGEMKNFLINSATAKEYGLESNNADTGLWFNEAMRSIEVAAGDLKQQDVLNRLGTGLYLTNLHYINWSDPQAARITGMTRFACFWIESGEIVAPIQDLRFDDSLYNFFGNELEALTTERSRFVQTITYQKRMLGGMIVPGVLLNKMNFTL